MIYDVYSFDFDGCLANFSFLSSTYKDILTVNRTLLDIIKTSRNKKIVLVGSNRQAPRDDLGNSTADERGSCYPATLTIANELDAIFDDLLLADIYNDLPAGESLKQALKYIAANNKDYKEIKSKNFNKLYNWIHDTSKLTTVYAQMHKLASEHTDDFFNFYLVDDKKEDILEELYNYFLKYPQMIPPNVKLHFRHYRGTIDRNHNKIDPLYVDYPGIQGSGPEPDKNYRQTVKNIAAVTIEKMTEQGRDIAATKTTRPVATYTQAQGCNFDMDAINCVKYYVPGMLPASSPEALSSKKEKQLSDPRKTRPYKEMYEAKALYQEAGSSHTSSSSSSIEAFIPAAASSKQSSFRFFPAEKPESSRKIADGLLGKHKKNTTDLSQDASRSYSGAPDADTPSAELADRKPSQANTDSKESSNLTLPNFSS